MTTTVSPAPRSPSPCHAAGISAWRSPPARRPSPTWRPTPYGLCQARRRQGLHRRPGRPSHDAMKSPGKSRSAVHTEGRDRGQGIRRSYQPHRPDNQFLRWRRLLRPALPGSSATSALLVRTESLILTDELLSKAYARQERPTRPRPDRPTSLDGQVAWTADYPQPFRARSR